MFADKLMEQCTKVGHVLSTRPYGGSTCRVRNKPHGKFLQRNLLEHVVQLTCCDFRRPVHSLVVCSHLFLMGISFAKVAHLPHGRRVLICNDCSHALASCGGADELEPPCE